MCAACSERHMLTRDAAQETDGKATLLGFIGSPFTLAAYAVEGKANKNCLEVSAGLPLTRCRKLSIFSSHIAGEPELHSSDRTQQVVSAENNGGKGSVLTADDDVVVLCVHTDEEDDAQQP
eukprot:479112-Rhodomonas_salina.3